MQPDNQNLKTKKQEKKVLSDLFFKYIPYWPVFVVLLSLCMFCAWFYLRITPKQYEAGASIMIKDESKGAIDQEMMTELDKLTGKKLIENEVEVLKSKTLMEDVVNSLHLYASFFEAGKVSEKPAYHTSPVSIEFVHPETLREREKVEFFFSENDSQVVIGPKKYPMNQVVETEFGQLKFVPNKNYSYRAEGQLFFSLMKPGAAAGSYGSRLKVIGSRTSTVIALSQRDEVPARAEEVLNELIVAYNKATINDKTRMALNTLNFVDKRLAVVEKELQEIEQRAQTYKSSREAVDIGKQGEMYLKNVGDIDQKMGEVNIQLSVLDEVEKSILSKDTHTPISPTTLGLKDPVLTDLIYKLNEKELAHEKLTKTTGENNPIVTSLKGEISKLKPGVLENIRNQRSSLNASKLNLAASNNTYATMLQKIPKKERDLIDINRQQVIKSGIYSFLLQKREEGELSVQSTMIDSRVVDKANASYAPVSPKPMMIYMLAVFFAFALPVGFINVKGMLNRKITFRKEIEDMTSFPIIGEVAHDITKDPVVIQEGKRTFIAEQFRRIRTSLAYLGVNHAGKKKVLVTSSLSGEGKSFVALNLSLSLAMTGKKVILLELDLANPSLSDKLNVNYEKGVSNYLWGECEPEEVIKRTSVNTNLFFLPAGTLPDNPSELLMSERLKDLLNYLEDIFDYVIIDSAPSTLLSDAYVLSPLCHATLYVVKHKYTPKVYIERLEQDNLIHHHLVNVGIIFNGIRSRGFTKNGYGYGYGYGYIYDNSGNKVKKHKKAESYRYK
ncbi:MAG: polysaccharide biosynthesis tyrosine autokinase [Chitinophagaceae bacterium]|nr:polysaccharide biosynthesis tyrosine autokinase [Chitinophagaceae bacterium]